MKKDILKCERFSLKFKNNEYYIFTIYNKNKIDFILNQKNCGYNMDMFSILKNDIKKYNTSIEKLILNNIENYISIYINDLEKLEN